ncbi:hypothetical protein L218DRAFT_1006253 [Marasmius fiardii PR-910]|nr:hypothetical protein L218DRAFT_1006253 [Marasmius fiardii PR-910]
MAENFENNTARQEGLPFPINSINSPNVGENPPLNSFNGTQNFTSGFPSGFNQGSVFNPAQFNQFGPPNMFSGWYPNTMFQQPAVMTAPRSSGVSGMEVDKVEHPAREDSDIIRLYKESAQRAKAKASSLEAKLSAVTTDYERRLSELDGQHHSKYNSLQEKYNVVLEEKSRLIVENTSLKESIDRVRREFTPSRGGPYRRDNSRTNLPRRRNDYEVEGSTPRFNGRHASSPCPVDWDHFVMPFINREMALSTLENSGYRTGGDKTLVNINFLAADGIPSTSPYIDSCLANNITPTPTVFPAGPRIGLQVMPATPGDLLTLVTDTASNGNVKSLYNIRLALAMAQLLEQTREFAPQLNPFVGSEQDILSKVREANPVWAHNSKFLDYSTYRIAAIPIEWATPVEIPAISAPSELIHRHNYGSWAQYFYVHGEPFTLLGQFMTDTGFYDAESVRAGRILSETTPKRTAKDRDAFDAFRYGFIALISKPGLYEELLEKYSITIANGIRLFRPTQSPPYSYQFMAKLLADFGLSIVTVNSMNRFGWQFCIDMQYLTTNPPSVKAQYVALLNEARFRALFFPIQAPGPNAIQRVPDHWNMSQVIEYRRRRAQLALLREDKIVTSGYQLRRTLIFPPGADDLGFQELSVSSDDLDGSPNVGDNPVQTSDNDALMASTSSGN